MPHEPFFPCNEAPDPEDVQLIYDGQLMPNLQNKLNDNFKIMQCILDVGVGGTEQANLPSLNLISYLEQVATPATDADITFDVDVYGSLLATLDGDHDLLIPVLPPAGFRLNRVITIVKGDAADAFVWPGVVTNAASFVVADLGVGTYDFSILIRSGSAVVTGFVQVA